MPTQLPTLTTCTPARWCWTDRPVEQGAGEGGAWPADGITASPAFEVTVMTNKSAEWMSQCAYGPQPRPPHSVLSSHSLGGCAPRCPCLGEGLLLGGHAGTLSHVTLCLLSQCQVLLPLRVGV